MSWLDFIYHLDPATLAAWIGLFIAALGILIGIGGVIWQMRKQWLLHSADMITTLSETFSSEEMRRSRSEFASLLRDHWNGKQVDLSNDIPILGFLENIGHLVKRGALDERMVYNKFAWQLFRYAVVLKASVQRHANL